MLRQKGKSQGIMKFDGCDGIEIPLDPGVYEDAVDDIIATLNEGGGWF